MEPAVLSQPGRPLHITYLITDLKVGGVPLHLYRLATRVAAEGAVVQVICLAGEGPVAAMLRRGGVPVLTCNARSALDVRALARLWRLLRKHPPDVLHALLFHANIAARLTAPLAGMRTSRILCEIQTAERERLWHLVLDNLTCRLCRCEIANSESVLQHLHRSAHIPLTRLHCEWGAVDTAAIQSAPASDRRMLGVGDEELLLVWTGRLDPVKGFEEMLAAFSIVARELPVRLLLAGEGPYRTRVEALIAQHGLGDRVHLLGQRGDVPSLLKAADLFLFCSRTEGLPNALLEAMAAGLPAVATDVPGCRDLIRDGDTGLLAPAGCPERIASAVRRVLELPDRGRAMGARARQWVTEHADAADLGKRWIELYQRMLVGGPAGVV